MTEVTPVVETAAEAPVTVSSVDMIIEVATKLYQVSLDLIRLKHPLCSFARNPYLVDLEALGYALVRPTMKPEGDVITEGKPELKEGGWYRTWIARDWTEEELHAQLVQKKAELNSMVMTVRADDFEMGVAYSPSEGVEFNVQLRAEDRINLVLLNTQARAAIAAEDETLEQFRSYENKTFELTPQQLVDMTDKALVGIKSIYRKSWELKDQIDTATKLADLPSVPHTFILV